MSELITKFRKDLRLAGYAKRSIQAYVPTVLRLQRFCNKPVEEVTEQDLIDYWNSCTEDCGWDTSTMRISYSGIKRFFQHTLVREWPIFDRIHLKRKETLPLVLSRQETVRIIRALPTLQSRTFYTTLYSTGLRLWETLTLRPADILTDRGMIHVHEGKGARDRMVPLPEVTLQMLRTYYRTHKNERWIFPALGRNNGKHAGAAETHVSANGVQGVLRSTLKRLGIRKHVHPHTFRHSYATHLIEANVPIRHVQQLLGHKDLKSTMVYLHVTTHAQIDSHHRVRQIMQGVLS
jgi:integrase/recombinase XerD